MKIIIIGSSTGGPRILFDIFSGLPSLPVAIIIVQHMPQSTTPRFAKRLSQICQLDIIIPKDGECLKAGTVFIAPGDYHLVIKNNEEMHLDSSEKVNFVRPAIDVTMLSLTKNNNHQYVGIILSGMGSDGAEGLAHVKRIGGTAIIQDPSTCTIPSMPDAAQKSGEIDQVLTPDEIHQYLLSLKN